VRSTSSERLVGVPPTIGERFIAADGELIVTGGAGGGGAGERIAGDVPVPLLATGAIGGTAITAVLPGGAGAAFPPAGILIVGMPMIVAERGGIDADAAVAAAAGALLLAATGATGAAVGGDAAVAWPGFATPVAALRTISMTFSTIACVSHGLGRFASAPTCVPRAASYGAAFPIRMATGMFDVLGSDLSARQRS
jgi:hypothetical protein